MFVVCCLWFVVAVKKAKFYHEIETTNNKPQTTNFVMRIFLIGFMGTGKTHWGKIWAKEKGLSFYDLDEVIEQQHGLTISKIFEKEGESQFRIWEKDALHSFGQMDQFILSCGGGTPCFFDNMDWMNAQGITIYLRTPAPELAARLMKEKDHRPLVNQHDGETLEQYVDHKLKEREKFYAAAKIQVETHYIANQSFDQIIRHYA